MAQLIRFSSPLHSKVSPAGSLQSQDLSRGWWKRRQHGATLSHSKARSPETLPSFIHPRDPRVPKARGLCQLPAPQTFEKISRFWKTGVIRGTSVNLRAHTPRIPTPPGVACDQTAQLSVQEAVSPCNFPYSLMIYVVFISSSLGLKLRKEEKNEHRFQL